jgi:hypothetical protein
LIRPDVADAGYDGQTWCRPEYHDWAAIDHQCGIAATQPEGRQGDAPMSPFYSTSFSTV